MNKATLNWLLAAALALLLSAAHLLDGPDDRSAEHAQALSLQDAIKKEAANARMARAAAEICGINAGWVQQSDSSISCRLHNGKRTRDVVQVSAVRP
jgi:hypothetical protein